MTTRPLPSDQLDLLLPILTHLAEMAHKKSRLNREDLQLLLLTSGLDEDWALDELERWLKVLTAVVGVSDPDKRELAQRALMLRNVPEANAILAVSAAAGATQAHISPEARRLKVNVASLDLGVLAPGQAGSAEFEVQGGPGQIEIESDQLVTPQQFSAGANRVRVDAKPLPGGVLWTMLRLVTAGETLEVPILAQWDQPLAAVSHADDAVNAPAMPNPFVFRNGYNAFTVEELVQACVRTPADGVFHLIGSHFEPWLSYIGRPDLASSAAQARAGTGSKENRLKHFLNTTGIFHRFQPTPPAVSPTRSDTAKGAVAGGTVRLASSAAHTFLIVVPDGGGDFRCLREAVEHAPRERRYA